MKDIIGSVLILIGYLATAVGAYMLIDWLGVIISGLWLVAMGIIILISRDETKK